jgi:hypothetical protein
LGFKVLTGCNRKKIWGPDMEIQYWIVLRHLSDILSFTNGCPRFYGIQTLRVQHLTYTVGSTGEH